MPRNEQLTISSADRQVIYRRAPSCPPSAGTAQPGTRGVRHIERTSRLGRRAGQVRRHGERADPADLASAVAGTRLLSSLHALNAATSCSAPRLLMRIDVDHVSTKTIVDLTGPARRPSLKPDPTVDDVRAWIHRRTSGARRVVRARCPAVQGDRDLRRLQISGTKGHLASASLSEVHGGVR